MPDGNTGRHNARVRDARGSMLRTNLPIGSRAASNTRPHGEAGRRRRGEQATAKLRRGGILRTGRIEYIRLRVGPPWDRERSDPIPRGRPCRRCRHRRARVPKLGFQTDRGEAVPPNPMPARRSFVLPVPLELGSLPRNS